MERIMDSNSKMKQRFVQLSHVISWLFAPYAVPLWGFVALFLFSYLQLMPLQYKLVMLAIVASFTLFLPISTIMLYKKINGWALCEMSVERTRRNVPIILLIISYASGLVMMYRLNLPWYMLGVILSALLVQIICLILNIWWRVSEHMAGAGLMIGGLIAFSAMFGYNPIWWLCILIFIAGLLGSSRMVVAHHNLGELFIGLIIGLFCSLSVLHPIGNLIIRLLII